MRRKIFLTILMIFLLIGIFVYNTKKGMATELKNNAEEQELVKIDSLKDRESLISEANEILKNRTTDSVGLNFPKQYYLDSFFQDDIEQYKEDLIDLFNSKGMSEGDSEKKADSVIEIETDIAKNNISNSYADIIDLVEFEDAKNYLELYLINSINELGNKNIEIMESTSETVENQFQIFLDNVSDSIEKKMIDFNDMNINFNIDFNKKETL